MDKIQESYRGRSVLVTGAAGFIGSNLSRRLSDLGADVRCVDIVDGNFGANMFNLDGYEQRVKFIAADIGDQSRMAEVIEGVDIVFNLAAQIGHGYSMEHPLIDLDLNLRSHVAFLELCRKHNPQAHIVLGSTRQIYGRPQYLPVDESHPIDFVDVNAINRYALEKYLLLYHRLYDLGATIIRMTNVYGPRMRIMDGRQTFVGLWLRRVVENEMIDIFGDGAQLRDLNHVDDVVDALLSAGCAQPSGEIYNLGGEPVSLMELAQRIVRLAGKGHWKTVPFPAARQAIDIGDYHGDFSKIAGQLGWRPAIDLDAGLASTIAYYERHLHDYCEPVLVGEKA